MKTLTIPQALERLAVLDDFLVKIRTNKYGKLYELPFSCERFSNRDLSRYEIKWQIFGAVCQRIQAKGWNWSVVFGTCNTYTFRIFKEPNIGNINDPYSALVEDKCIVASSLNALVQALEEQDCPECEGMGHIEYFRYGSTIPHVAGDCPACNGTGKEAGGGIQ